MDLGLAFIHLDMRNAGHRYRVTSRGGEKQVFELLRGIPGLERIPHANSDQSIATNHIGRQLAVHHGSLDIRNVLDTEARALRFLRVDAEVHRRADHDRLVHDINYAFDFRKPFFNLLGHLFEDLGIVVVDLDLDRLGRPSQVADQIFEDVRKLDLDSRLGRGDLSPQFRSNFVQRPLAVFLEPDQKIAGVRFRNRQRETRAGAAGVAFNFGGFTQELFDVQQHTIGFLKRCSRRSSIIQNEGALVHVGKESATQMKVDAYGDG